MGFKRTLKETCVALPEIYIVFLLISFGNGHNVCSQKTSIENKAYAKQYS